MTDRVQQLKKDLEKTKFNLTDEQKTILNHYIRTALTVIKLELENARVVNCGCDEYCMCDSSYEFVKFTVEDEIDNIVKTLELINGN